MQRGPLKRALLVTLTIGGACFPRPGPSFGSAISLSDGTSVVRHINAWQFGLPLMAGVHRSYTWSMSGVSSANRPTESQMREYLDRLERILLSASGCALEKQTLGFDIAMTDLKRGMVKPTSDLWFVSWPRLLFNVVVWLLAGWCILRPGCPSWRRRTRGTPSISTR